MPEYLFWAHNTAEATAFPEHFISNQNLAITLASHYSVINDNQMAYPSGQNNKTIISHNASLGEIHRFAL